MQLQKSQNNVSFNFWLAQPFPFRFFLIELILWTEKLKRKRFSTEPGLSFLETDIKRKARKRKEKKSHFEYRNRTELIAWGVQKEACRDRASYYAHASHETRSLAKFLPGWTCKLWLKEERERESVIGGVDRWNRVTGRRGIKAALSLSG